MTLARLTRAWGEALRGAICRVEPDGRKVFDESEPPLVAASPAQAFALAGDLAALIDDMIIEGVDPERLDDLVTDNFDPYWRITLDFLKIAFAQWPAWLDERGLIDRARRGALLVDNEIAALALRIAARPDDHRRFDRDQPRHRAADRRHRPRAAGRGGAARPRPKPRRTRLGDDRRERRRRGRRRRPSAGRVPSAARRRRRRAQ